MRKFKRLAPEFRHRLAGALESKNDFVFLETLRPTGRERYSLLFTSSAAWLECGPQDDPAAFLARLDRETGLGGHWAGWFGYEFGYLLEPALTRFADSRKPDALLARIGFFPQPAMFDHHTGQFSGEWPQAGRQAMAAGGIGRVAPAISRADFFEAMAAIKKYILAGDTYQINFTFPLHFTVTGSLAGLYLMLSRNQSVSHAAWIRCRGQDIMSFSPELFFRIDDSRGRITTRPMKGTAKRGRDCREDARLAHWLRNDDKSRGENVMIVDLLRNDLARLVHALGGGRVEVESLFDIEIYESLLQMTSTISARSSGARVPLSAAMPALFPCGSVTGAPKIRAMEIIAELEQVPRGVYCGAIGHGNREGVCLNVPIRTLTMSRGRGVMPVGAGIVHDSDPESEWRECLLKARFLTRPRPGFALVETLLWRPDKGYHLLEEHLARLESSARYFGYPFVLKEVEEHLARAVREAGERCLRVRLLLDREGKKSVASAAVTWPAGPPAEASPARIALAGERMNPDNIFLYHKTTHRPWYEKGRREAEQRGVVDLLYANTLGELTEGTIFNFFYSIKGTLYTPPLASGLLPGTLRASLLDSGKVRERAITLAELAGTEEIFMGNSVRGLLPVRLIDQ